MTVGRIGTISEDGVSVVYDTNSEDMLEMRIPCVPIGTEFCLDEEGNWRVVFTEGMSEPERKRLQESEDFYYLTRHFLSYRDYSYVQSKFPTSCATQFRANPFFLADFSRENTEAPVASVPQIDRSITLPTFADRQREMRYILRYCLESNESDGHTWISYGELNKKAKALLAANGHPLQTGSVASFLRYFARDFYFEECTPLSESRVALMTSYQRELSIYRVVMRSIAMDNLYPQYHPVQNDDFSTEQNRAVRYLITKGGHLSILTGGPGTGKTTILRELVSQFSSAYPDVKIHLLSPTGRAARRIKEVFGSCEVEVSTVHKFLGFGHVLTRRELNIIRSAGLVFVDEASMLDLELFERLLSMLNMDTTKLVLVGDVDQLPSIGAGNVLSDLINLGVHTERLTENYRSQGSIVSNSRRINSGITELKEDESFRIVEIPPNVADYLAGMNQHADIIITPYRNADRAGTTRKVNSYAQLRRFGFPGRYDGYHVGDIVIMEHTNYKQGYFNGEAGVIMSYSSSGDYLVNFGDRQVTVKDTKDMSLGYAITVHKSQGSEYPNGIICIPEYCDFITRRMLYTAVTRAKEVVTIMVSDRESLRKVILNNPEETRRTFLSSFPKEMPTLRYIT